MDDLVDTLSLFEGCQDWTGDSLDPSCICTPKRKRRLKMEEVMK